MPEVLEENSIEAKSLAQVRGALLQVKEDPPWGLVREGTTWRLRGHASFRQLLPSLYDLEGLGDARIDSVILRCGKGDMDIEVPNNTSYVWLIAVGDCSGATAVQRTDGRWQVSLKQKVFYLRLQRPVLRLRSERPGAWLVACQHWEAKPADALARARRAGLWPTTWDLDAGAAETTARARPTEADRRELPDQNLPVQVERWRLRAAQELDEDAGPLIKFFETGYRGVRRQYGASEAEKAQRDSGQFAMEEGLLSRKQLRPNGEMALVPMLPVGGSRAILVNGKRYVLTWRNFMLHSMHNTSSGGHVGSVALEARIKEHCWWPNLARDCESWTRRCVHCRAIKGKVVGSSVLVSQRYTSPFRILQIDLITDLRPESEGCLHVLSCVDGFSLWLWLVPLDKKDAGTVAAALYLHVY